jgi:hypothetical protein
MTHFKLILLEICGDVYRFYPTSLNDAQLLFKRNNSGSIIHAHVVEIHAERGKTGAIVDVLILKQL